MVPKAALATAGRPRPPAVRAHPNGRVRRPRRRARTSHYPLLLAPDRTHPPTAPSTPREPATIRCSSHPTAPTPTRPPQRSP